MTTMTTPSAAELEIPTDVRAAATALRTTFGPSVKLLRVTGAVDLGNPAWDWYCREVDGEQTGERHDHK